MPVRKLRLHQRNPHRVVGKSRNMLVRLTDNRPVAVETTNVIAERYYKDEVTIFVTDAARGTGRTIMVPGSVDDIAHS